MGHDGGLVWVVDHVAALQFYLSGQLQVRITRNSLVGGQIVEYAGPDLLGSQLLQELVDPDIIHSEEGEAHLPAQLPHPVSEEVVIMEWAR